MIRSSLGVVLSFAVATSLPAQSCQRAVWGVTGFANCAGGACSYGDDIAVGDVNGDGRPDVISGAPFGFPPRVFVRSGADGSLLHAITGATNSRFGWAVDTVGDIDHDGIEDFAVGAPYEDRSTGTVRIYSGATGALLRTLAGAGSFAFYGYFLAGLGDVDGDGTGDLIVGSGHETFAQVVSGATGLAIYTYTTAARAVGRCGDVNGDWCADFAVAPGPGGLVTIYSGADGSVLRGIGSPFPPGSRMELAPAGDVDQDGVPDLLVGAGDANGGGGAGSGAAWLVSGATGAKLFTKLGGAALGWSVGGGGDANGDGWLDFAVGSVGTSPGGVSAGRADVFSGHDGSLLFSILGGPGDWMGTACRLADTNGNGVAELVVGAALQDYLVSFPVSGTIRLVEMDLAPWFDELESTTITVFAGTPISLPVSARDVSCSGQPLTLAVTGAPAGGLFSQPLPAAATGQSPSLTTVFCWTPSGADVGTHQLQFTAVDGAQASATMPVTLQVVQGLLLLGPAPADVPIDGLDRLLVDFGIWLPIVGPSLPTLPVPDLAGLPIYAQVALWSPEVFPADPLQLSHGLRIVVGAGATNYGDGGSAVGVSLDQAPLPGQVVTFRATVE